ncbi:MAG: pro-sigmaK processing inhibitor BofA family protein [Peptococcaceae bacterium]|nr:pro-sigmaK processing inhibitor BofA family protein [Peptococcaceae bacterium]
MTLVFLLAFIGLIALIVYSSLHVPGKIVKAAIHVLGGLAGLWLTNLLLNVVGVTIPINTFTVVFVAVAGFPGVVALAVLQFLGI